MIEAPPASSEPRVSVIVTVLNDKRVSRTLSSLQRQSLLPFEILVADGGSTDGTFELASTYAQMDPRIVPLRLPGTIPETRNQALRKVRGEFVAFLDADEEAPESWLKALLAPFSDPKVGFTGGPTPAMPGTKESLGARYYDAYLQRFYDLVARKNPHALPMGNSAWRKAVFESVGQLDTTLFPRAASEDQDMALRTLQAGWKGVYVPEAWVHHDFSDLALANLLRKQATYATGGYVLWRRKKTTYEATPGRVGLYILPPFLLVLGALFWLLLPASVRLVGDLFLLAGGATLAGLLAGLIVDGERGESRYPGWKLRPLEILRRWATVYGAFRGFLRYGWSGRRNLPAEPGAPRNV